MEHPHTIRQSKHGRAHGGEDLHKDANVHHGMTSPLEVEEVVSVNGTRDSSITSNHQEVEPVPSTIMVHFLKGLASRPGGTVMDHVCCLHLLHMHLNRNVGMQLRDMCAPQLVSLHLRKCTLTAAGENLPFFHHAPVQNLKELVMWHCSETQRDPLSVQDKYGDIKLSTTWTPSLGRCTSLTTLEYSPQYLCQLTHQDKRVFKHLSTLQALKIPGCVVQDGGVEVLLQDLPHLRDLEVYLLSADTDLHDSACPWRRLIINVGEPRAWGLTSPLEYLPSLPLKGLDFLSIYPPFLYEKMIPEVGDVYRSPHTEEDIPIHLYIEPNIHDAIEAAAQALQEVPLSDMGCASSSTMWKWTYPFCSLCRSLRPTSSP